MRIAILPRFIDLKTEARAWDLKHYVNHDFEMMAQKFGIALYSVISPCESEDICSFCDGLIIPGSNNKVNPSYYGGEAMDPPPVYDDFARDYKMIDYFVKNNKPVFGICAGHQAINIYFGGSIGYITNDGTKPHYSTNHSVNIKPGSFIHSALGTEKTMINSYHVMHIDKLGNDLDVTATSDEGIIEAIQHKEKNVFGVQWHPERSFRGENPAEVKIFENFLECCRK